MNKRISKAICYISSLITISLFIPTSIDSSASSESVTIVADMYKFSEKSSYDIDSNEPYGSSVSEKTLGKLSVNGDIIKQYEKNGFNAFEIADGDVFSLTYTYDNTLSNAGQEEWHLTTDDNKSVNGVNLGDKINKGALILQTSIDAQKWVTLSKTVNLNDDKIFDNSTTQYINDIQLYNGCYYRVIVAYATTKLDEADSFLWFDTSDYSNQKTAEVYKFYASYKGCENENAGEKKYFPAGAKSEYTSKTNNNDYKGKIEIDEDDPHYGWDLGAFCLSGYTDIGDSPDVYLKTVGDKIKLSFQLEYDIDNLPKLKGHTKPVYIARDKNGSDAIFSIASHDMKHGELTIKYTDSEGKYTFTTYSDYLKSLAYPGADTTVQLFEEGDYEVHLNYAITDEDGIDETFYYRTSFSFKIRNGNCMVYLFDSNSGTELANGDSTQNGFKIDSAKSDYPRLTVKKQILNEGKNGLIEDTKFNGAVSDGKIFTEEGIYTITATNRYKNDLKTEKTIYVGKDSVLTAYTRNSGQYTISQLNDMVEKGWSIDSKGTLIEPVVTEPTTESQTEVQTTIKTTTASQTTASATTSTIDAITNTITNENSPENKSLILKIAGVGIIAVLSAICVIIMKKKRHKEDK